MNSNAREVPQLGDAFSVAHKTTGRTRMKLQRAGSASLLERGQLALIEARGVHSVEAHAPSRSLIVYFDPQQVTIDRLLALPLPNEAAAYPTAVAFSVTVPAEIELAWQQVDSRDNMSSLLGGLVKMGPAPARETEPWPAELALAPGKRLRVEVSPPRERIPGREVAFDISGDASARIVVTLTPVEGGTAIRERIEYSPGDGLIAELVDAAAIRPHIRSVLESHLSQLAQLLEER